MMLLFNFTERIYMHNYILHIVSLIVITKDVFVNRLVRVTGKEDMTVNGS